MRIVGIAERSVGISRYDDSALPTGGLTTSIVALVTDQVRDGRPVIGYGFGSVGRFAQGGLIRERFAPRLQATDLAGADGGLDPVRGWHAMMRDEKPGGHGERCVAVGTLDMALWDAAGKLAGLPLWRLLAAPDGRAPSRAPRVPVYAGGGYPYPADDLARLADEMHRLRDRGYTHAKIKIGAAPLDQDRRRIEVAAAALGDAGRLAVDALNRWDAPAARAAAAALAPLGLWWLEDVCDPHDLETQAAVAALYPGPLAAGEALFSTPEALLLDRHGGLRRGVDRLLFDPAHCYGLPGYRAILSALEARGWPRHAFWPHGGHLFGLHVAAGLGLGGAESNPLCFAPFGGLPGDCPVIDGRAAPPESPGLGIETMPALHALMRGLHGD